MLPNKLRAWYQKMIARILGLFFLNGSNFRPDIFFRSLMMCGFLISEILQLIFGFLILQCETQNFELVNDLEIFTPGYVRKSICPVSLGWCYVIFVRKEQSW
tara:strand:+ start:174 stop:479 length:306 start_codon:yes stop_codon:yes gene_type:complete